MQVSKKDTKLQHILTDKKSVYQLKKFCEGGKTLSLICFNDKIDIPKPLQLRITQWYHIHLCHAGETITKATIKQHFT